MAQTQRRLYQGAYRTELNEDVVTPTDTPADQDADAGNTGSDDPTETPEDRSWKKRYGDLRTHNNSLTERIRTLETQLQAAQKQEVRIPSTKEELQSFAQKYPDMYRLIRSVAMTELLQERENIAKETASVKEDLDRVTQELGLKRIIQAHPDFEELNMSEEFHEWARHQPKQIQDWLYESSDPTLCIKALDLYKAEHNFKKKPEKKTSAGADAQIRTRTPPELTNPDNKRIWKASEIGKMHPKLYEKHEEEIERAREEGRIEFDI